MIREKIAVILGSIEEIGQFLAKPISSDELRGIVDEVLGERSG
jgi:hypothetical protein